MNNMEMTTALVTSPSAAFADLKEKPKFWFPLLAVLLSTVAVLVWYYNFVDFDWLIDRMMSADTRTQQMPEDQRAHPALRAPLPDSKLPASLEHRSER